MSEKPYREGRVNGHDFFDYGAETAYVNDLEEVA